jgi:ABC-2 type transport system permease protein
MPGACAATALSEGEAVVGVARYFRLLAAFARFSLLGELAFRANFLVKLLVEILWLAILLIFYRTIYGNTRVIAGWTEEEYLFFVGCHFTIGGLIETFFLSNCTEFSELIRSGDLDLYLLRPIDEQFLISCRSVDWSTVPNVLLGGVLIVHSLAAMNWPFDPVRGLVFLVLLGCGTALAYSFLVLLMSTAVWLVRNQSLMELWWLFTTVMRYPREIFTRSWAQPIGWFFWYLLPVLLVVNVPADVMVEKFFDPWAVGQLIVATGVMLYLSRRFFRFSLQRYRSASS